MEAGLNVMSINIKGMDEFKRCADNVLKSEQQLEEAVQEFNECELIIDAYPNTKEKDKADKVEFYHPSFGECESPCANLFGREDLDDIISDLQEEYYRLGNVNVSIKIQIADLIDRLCRLREMLSR